MRRGALLAALWGWRLAAGAELHLVGSAELLSDRLRLTPSTPNSVGAAWYPKKQRVRGGFTATFEFQLSDPQGLGPGADGFAFVLQNDGPNAIGNRGSAGGFGLGETKKYKGKGIPRSLAVFFDAFRNEFDDSDNSIAICTNGTVKKMRWPPSRLGVADRLPFRIKDKQVHAVRVTYSAPLLSVFVDGGETPVLRTAVDLAAVTDEAGYAWAGFTASTGAGYENHDILHWSMVAESSSVMTTVESSVQFLDKITCLEGRNLCTPGDAVVEGRGPGSFHVILPGHVAWAASIPNAAGAAVMIANPRGYICRGASGAQTCANAGVDAVAMKNEAGRTWFEADKLFPDNQGFFEFDAVLR